MLRRSARLVVLSLILAALIALTGCESEYASGYAFYPQPAAVQVVHPTGPQHQLVPLTVLVTILGVRNADARAHVPYSLEVRMRLESNGPDRVLFDPRTLEMTNGALRPFPPPITEPPGIVVLPPGRRQEVTAYFPFPPGTDARNFDLSTLRLRWRVDINDHPVIQTAYFQRGRPQNDAYNSDLYY